MKSSFAAMDDAKDRDNRADEDLTRWPRWQARRRRECRDGKRGDGKRKKLLVMARHDVRTLTFDSAS